ncbi:hypothetical protein AUJ14_04230 [Candidatus Micrarchaeota archaeon CG1_02_55_22]|nr:MAG: hypothetical protein AUJ14_04230 [Candidatus Micrarchaeota archaeon CG1_02_55_22]
MTTDTRELYDAKKTETDELRKVSRTNAELISAFKSTLDSLKMEKVKRGEKSSAARELVKKKHVLVTEARKIGDEIRTLTGDAKPGSPPAHEAPGLRQIREQLERLEWRQQTEGLSPNKEKAMGVEIKRLRQQLPAIEADTEKRKNVGQLYDARRKLSDEIRELDSKIDSLFAEAEASHEKIVGLSRKADSLRERITTNFDVLGEHEKKRELLGDELREAQKKEREQDDGERRAIEAAERKAHAEQLASLKERSTEIRERLKTGKKVSFEELQILAAVDGELKL